MAPRITTGTPSKNLFFFFFADADQNNSRRRNCHMEVCSGDRNIDPCKVDVHSFAITLDVASLFWRRAASVRDRNRRCETQDCLNGPPTENKQVHLLRKRPVLAGSRMRSCSMWNNTRSAYISQAFLLPPQHEHECPHASMQIRGSEDDDERKRQRGTNETRATTAS